jgi:hypothetical protein
MPQAITGWIQAGTLDPALAALTSILIENERVGGERLDW